MLLVYTDAVCCNTQLQKMPNIKHKISSTHGNKKWDNSTQLKILQSIETQT